MSSQTLNGAHSGRGKLAGTQVIQSGGTYLTLEEAHRRLVGSGLRRGDEPLHLLRSLRDNRPDLAVSAAESITRSSDERFYNKVHRVARMILKEAQTQAASGAG